MKSNNNPRHQKTNSSQSNTPTPSQVRIAQQPQTRHNQLNFTPNPLPLHPVLPTIATTNSQATFNPLPPHPVLPTRLMAHSQSTPNLLPPQHQLPTGSVTRSQSTQNMSRNSEIPETRIDIEAIMNEDINEHAEEILLKKINSLESFFASKKNNS